MALCSAGVPEPCGWRESAWTQASASWGQGLFLLFFCVRQSICEGILGFWVSAVATESTSLLLIQYDMPHFATDSEWMGNTTLWFLNHSEYCSSFFLSSLFLLKDLTSQTFIHHLQMFFSESDMLCSLLPQVCQVRFSVCMWWYCLLHPFRYVY